MGRTLRVITWTLLLLSLQTDAVRLENTPCGNPKVKKSPLPLSDHPLVPFYVSLIMTDKFDPICSGTIISEEFVLTSGRCVKQIKQKSKLRAVVGFTYSNVGDKNDRFEISEIEPSKDGELALLKLNNKIVFSEKVSNICLPTVADNIANSSMFVPYWKSNNGLSSLEYTPTTPSSCPNKTDDKLCFKITERQRCLLDDAAPLISVKKSQITLSGIIEIGNICQSPKIGRAINVHKYLQWIRDTTKISGCKNYVGFHVKSVSLKSDIINRFAQTKAEVTVVNFSPVAQEISYDFYHPDSAVVTDLEMTIDSYTFKGYTTKAATAGQVYKQSNRTAVLLEVSRTNDHVVTLKANVSAFQAVNFSMTYQDFLIRESDTVKMLFGLFVDDKPENVKAEISVSEIGPFNDFVVFDMVENFGKSTIKVQQKERNRKCLPRAICKKVIAFDVPIRRESNSTNPDEDRFQQIKLFSFEYKPSTTFTGEIIEDGFFAYFLPSSFFPLTQKLVIFILDISGSMRGMKVSQMKNAMITMLDSLKEEDLFQIITFESNCRSLFSLPLRSNEKNIRDAADFILKIEPYGLTNAYCALHAGLSSINKERKKHNVLQPIIYFLSDGAANQEMERRPIVESLLRSTRAPVHGIAFGRDADLPFVEKISNLSKGKSVKLEENSNVYLKLEQFFFELTSTSRDEIKIEMNCAGFQSNVTSNRWGRMLFKEPDRVIVGKQADEPITIQFRGQPLIEIPKSDVKSNETLPCKPPKSIERLWAYLLVKNTGSLKDALTKSTCKDSNYESHEIDREQLALKYNLVTNLTSMVITQDVDITEIDGQGTTVFSTPSTDTDSDRIVPGYDDYDYDHDIWELTSGNIEIKDEVWFYSQTFNRDQPIKLTETTSDTSIAFQNNPKMATSFRILGNSNWIFYSKKNFKGHMLVFKPGDYKEAEKLGALFRNVLSIKKM